MALDDPKWQWLVDLRAAYALAQLAALGPDGPSKAMAMALMNGLSGAAQQGTRAWGEAGGATRLILRKAAEAIVKGIPDEVFVELAALFDELGVPGLAKLRK